MTKKTDNKRLDTIREVIGDEPTIEILDSKTVQATWPDGSSAPLEFTPDGKWRFCEEHSTYRQGYDYACGYHD